MGSGFGRDKSFESFVELGLCLFGRIVPIQDLGNVLGVLAHLGCQLLCSDTRIVHFPNKFTRPLCRYTNLTSFFIKT